MVVVVLNESKDGVNQELEYDESSSDECDTPVSVISMKFDKTDLSINTNPLPHGKYTLIGIDIDTTGRRLIDEIVQISAFTPDQQYAQYIMPLMNLNPAARQRHQVRVITVGFFRMLKSMQTYRVMKTKMEIAALNEFIDWLEERRREDEGSEGIVLVYHEQRKFVPYMVIEALKKYKLLDRFAESVKSFVNGFKLAEEKCTKTIKYLTIRQLAKLVLEEKDGSREGFEGNAAYRARMAFEISRRLATAEPKEISATSSPTEKEPNSTADSGEGIKSSSTAEDAVKVESDKTAENTVPSAEDDGEQKQGEEKEGAAPAMATSAGSASPSLTEEDRQKMCTVLCEYASPISTEISELDEQEKILVRQNSLRPVFLLYFKTTIYHRVKAVTYRRVLAECGLDYESLRQLWQENKREGLENMIKEIAELKEDECTELVELLDCHYDPDKQAFKPVVKRMKRRPSRGQPFFSNKNGNVPQNQNGNTQMAKENRKPFHGYQNNQKNHNNHHNGNNMINKQQNPQQNQQQQFYNGPSSPETRLRNGGSPGKRFFPRNSRRRRGGNGQNQNQNQNGGQQNQQQPMKNHDGHGNHHSYSNSNRHNHHQYQQPIPNHA